MAVFTANIYRATVYLPSGAPAGVQPISQTAPGIEVVIIAQTPASAVSILQQAYPNMVSYNGPVLQATGALTQASGTLMAEEETQQQPAPAKHEAEHAKRR